jgi:hypothetical protein
MADKYYSCSKCGNKFGDKGGLKTHMKDCDSCIAHRISALEDFMSSLTMVTTTMAAQITCIATKVGVDTEATKDLEALAEVVDTDTEVDAAPTKPEEASEAREVTFCVRKEKGKDELYRWNTSSKKYERCTQDSIKHVFTALIKRDYTLL